MTTLNPEEIEHPKLKIKNSVPWAKRAYTLSREIPADARPKVFQKNGIPKQCADKTKDLKGKSRIQAMNSCVAELSHIK